MLMDIDVNLDRKVRVNGGPWHGSAKHGEYADGEMAWDLVFHYKADESRIEKKRFHHVPQTESYLYVAPGSESVYNAMLIPKVELRDAGHQSSAFTD